MLTESAVKFPGTSWPWLLTEDKEAVDPFDYSVWTGKLGEEEMTISEDEIEHENERATLDKLHPRVLAEVVAALPLNKQLVEMSKSVLDSYCKKENPATSNFGMHATEYVAAQGDKPVAGTYGAGPCLPVLVRASNGKGVVAVGCAHLSENDMGSLAAAEKAITRLWAELDKTLGDTDPKTRQTFVVGGTTDDSADVMDSYARVVGACQRLQEKLKMQLAGAFVPASGTKGKYVDVYVTRDAVLYAHGK